MKATLAYLAALGVDEINLYPHVGDFEAAGEAYGREIPPALRQQT